MGENITLSVKYGSYVGTGATSMALTFSSNVYGIMVGDREDGAFALTAVRGVNEAITLITYSKVQTVNMGWSGNRVTWSSSQASESLNTTSRTYYYLAFLEK